MSPSDRPTVLQALFRILMKGESAKAFQAAFGQVDPPISISEIARASQELIGAGWSPATLRDLFRSALPLSSTAAPNENGPAGIPGHPVHTMRRENEALVQLIRDRVRPHLEDYAVTGSQASRILLRDDVARLSGIDVHYSKKENLMFPLLEQRGISAPSRVMRDADDQVRTSLRSIRTSLDSLDDPRKTLCDRLRDEVERILGLAELEQRFLIPLLMENLQESDWSVIASGEHDFGYFLIESVASWHPAGSGASESTGEAVTLDCATGRLHSIETEGLLRTLPLDITFVNRNDEIVFYTEGAGILNRKPEDLGTSVLLCHKPETRSAVQAILDSFREKRSFCEDQIKDINGRTVRITYQAVSDPDGAYLGTLETVRTVDASDSK